MSTVRISTRTILFAFVVVVCLVFFWWFADAPSEVRHRAKASLDTRPSWTLPIRLEVSCAHIAKEKPLVIFAFGQSNAANHGESRFTSLRPVYNYSNGRCYVAQDPLLDSTGFGGSVWIRLGDKLIAREFADSIIITSIGVSSSSIKQWGPDGNLHPKLINSLVSMVETGFKPDYLLWHQGETDVVNGTDEHAYIGHFKAMLDAIRVHDYDAPILVSVATLCHGKVSVEIQLAQQSLINPSQGIYPGPNTDSIFPQ